MNHSSLTGFSYNEFENYYLRFVIIKLEKSQLHSLKLENKEAFYFIIFQRAHFHKARLTKSGYK